MSDSTRYNELATRFVKLLRALQASTQGGGLGSAIGIFQTLMTHYATLAEVGTISSDPATRKENLSDFALELADVLTFSDPSAALKGIGNIDPDKLEAFTDTLKDLIDDLI